MKKKRNPRSKVAMREAVKMLETGEDVRIELLPSDHEDFRSLSDIGLYIEGDSIYEALAIFDLRDGYRNANP